LIGSHDGPDGVLRNDEGIKGLKEMNEFKHVVAGNARISVVGYDSKRIGASHEIGDIWSA